MVNTVSTRHVHDERGADAFRRIRPSRKDRGHTHTRTRTHAHMRARAHTHTQVGSLQYMGVGRDDSDAARASRADFIQRAEGLAATVIRWCVCVRASSAVCVCVCVCVFGGSPRPP